MDEAEIQKICRSCGADLRHKKRCKSRDGTYICSKCAKEGKRWDRQVIGKLADKKLHRLVLYVVLAALACIVFWELLDILTRMEWTPQ